MIEMSFGVFVMLMVFVVVLVVMSFITGVAIGLLSNKKNSDSKEIVRFDSEA